MLELIYTCTCFLPICLHLSNLYACQVNCLRADFLAFAPGATHAAGCFRARPASFRAPGMTPLPGRIRLDFDASEDPKGPLYRSGTETLERPSLAKISWAFSLGIVLWWTVVQTFRHSKYLMGKGGTPPNPANHEGAPRCERRSPRFAIKSKRFLR